MTHHVIEIDTLSISELASLGASTLAAMASDISRQAEELAGRKAKLEAACVQRYGDSLQRALVEAGKDTGTVNLTDPTSNSITIKATVSKTVEWDQRKLVAALDAMKPEDARHYAKAKFSVEEKKFAAAPPAVQAALSPARTIKPGKPKFEFVEAA